MPLNTSTEVPEGYMRDAAGRLVPLRNVKPEHLLEDELVRELHKLADAMEQQLVNLKDKSFKDIGALLDVLADKHKATKGSAKGNVTLNSYDGSLRVQVATGDRLTLGPELQVAKQLIDECLQSWSKGADPNILVLIHDAFDVGKEGKVRLDRILSLRRLDIQDERWRRAMDAIGEAIRVASSSRYVRFYRRKNHEEEYQQIPLDMAKVG